MKYHFFFVPLQWEFVFTPKDKPMKESKRILFISQEIYPYLEEETRVRMLNRRLPEYFQSHGYETRTFMPKFGEINERRNQLHEVIRLSGINLIINDTDHPLLIKVASIQSARLQIYFIDSMTISTVAKAWQTSMAKNTKTMTNAAYSSAVACWKRFANCVGLRI